jgi:hypothetical protein
MGSLVRRLPALAAIAGAFLVLGATVVSASPRKLDAALAADAIIWPVTADLAGGLR